VPRLTTFEGPLRRLVDAMGGVMLAARRMGVSRRTLLRWGTEETEPSSAAKARVNRLAMRFGLKRPYKLE
jgi:hypothetical protein